MHATAAVTAAPAAPFRLEQVEIEDPRAGEVLVEIHAVGICHTDLVFASGAMGTPFPAVFGHEGAGVVRAVGAGVRKVRPGDKVLLTFSSCGVCARCAADEPAYCHSWAAHNLACARPDGSTALHREGTPVAGHFFGQSSFASHAIAYERNVVPVAADADLGALAPLGCGIQTGVGAVVNSLSTAKGSSILVVGAGAVGLAAVLGARLAGCESIIVVEPHQTRRSLAEELGATLTCTPAELAQPDRIRSIVPSGLDYALDTSGNLDAIQATLGVLGPRGTLGLVGVPHHTDAALSLPIVPAMIAGITVTGIIEGDSVPDTFLPQLVRWHAEGLLPFDRFVRRYPFERINDAIADAHSGAVVKPVLTFG